MRNVEEGKEYERSNKEKEDQMEKSSACLLSDAAWNDIFAD